MNCKIGSKGWWLPMVPQKDLKGHNNIGYQTMTGVKTGDIIFYGADRKTYAISTVKTNGYCQL